VIAPAKTGNEKSSRKAVRSIDQTNKGVLFRVIPTALIFKMVVMKLIAETKLEVPAKCKEKIAKSTAPPL
jgi:hypothetical protein